MMENLRRGHGNDATLKFARVSSYNIKRKAARLYMFYAKRNRVCKRIKSLRHYES